MKFVTSVLTALSLTTCTSAFLPSLIERNTQSTQLFGTRTPIISGNWKLNPQTKEEAITLATEISEGITSESPDCEVALFVPYVFIEAAIAACDGKLSVGAEGVCPEMKGAFTGAVSASMLNSIGVQWALAGHSERRVIFGETDEYINGQVLKLLDEGMSCMLCIGESLSEYEQNLVGSVCAVQLKKNLAGVTKEQMSRVAVAYEPIWAIGTGKVATPEIAQSVHKTCRAVLAEIFDDDVADSTRILYGGSVTPESVDGLMAEADIDGALVGGASLDSTKFNRIINFQVE
jgi:triosephosphate isomerase